MMAPLLSFLTPSRHRPKELIKSIHSVRDNSPPGSFEFRIKTDNDDAETAGMSDEIESILPGDIHIHPGSRLRGYPDYHLFLTELAGYSKCPWVCVWNDDVTWNGRWFEQLQATPEQGFIVQQETHRLGGSTYFKVEGGPFPIVPNQFWKRFGLKQFPDPADTNTNLLLKRNGWKTKWLEGVGFHHNRKLDSTLTKDRL